MSGDYPSRTLDKIVIRAPDGMRDRIRKAAEENGRSMNSEIVARLEESLSGYFMGLSDVGFVALIKRLEATIEANEALLFSVRDELPGVEAVMAEHGMPRDKAIHFIVSDWLRERGYSGGKD